MIKWLSVAICAIALAFFGATYVIEKRRYENQLHEFMNPSPNSVVSALKDSIGIELPSGTDVLYARRTKPHPFFGDYRECALMAVGKSDLSKIKRRFDDAVYPAISDVCPDMNDRVRIFEQNDLLFLGRIQPESDEHYQLWISKDETKIYLETIIH